MAKFYDELNDDLRAFIERQQMFFVASAPNRGRVNLSPKGRDTFRCFSHALVGYLDLTGSGAETAAHARENGRLTFMFCSFDEKPLILRLYGRGEAIRPGDPKWDEYASSFEPLPGQRQIILLHIESVQTSCGFAVPRYEFLGERETLLDWARNKGDAGLADYWTTKNRESIDGLPTGLGVEH